MVIVVVDGSGPARRQTHVREGRAKLERLELNRPSFGSVGAYACERLLWLRSG